MSPDHNFDPNMLSMMVALESKNAMFDSSKIFNDVVGKNDSTVILEGK